jgi:hypothetical protein
MKKKSHIVTYIGSRNGLIPCNWQHHPILWTTWCTITYLRSSRWNLTINFLRMTTRVFNFITLKEAKNLVITTHTIPNLNFTQRMKLKKLTFEFPFRLGYLIGLLVPCVVSESWTFFNLPKQLHIKNNNNNNNKHQSIYIKEQVVWWKTIENSREQKLKRKL